MDEDSNNTIKDSFPEPRKKFWLRSRKRPQSDAISISSMDISMESDLGKKKKRRRITEVASSIFSSSTLSNKQSNILHTSFTIEQSAKDLSFVDNEADTETLKRKNKKNIENTNSLTLRSWVLDVSKISTKDRQNCALSRKEIKRQEAIYELYCGENVLIGDLCVLKDFYYEPLLPTGIFTSEELLTLFGGVTDLIKIHTKLRDELIELRDQYGCTDTIGPTILNWTSTLTEPYLERCRTQIWAKHLLDEKRLTNKRFQSFLRKRLESAHSNDLWTYIDVARSRIVKYPLLVKEILRHTPASHSDQTSLKEAFNMLSKLLNDIDRIMGIAECKLAQSKIHAKLEYDPSKCIENATELITEGPLKDTRGMKFQCFLFDTGLAIARRSRPVNKRYNLSSPVVLKEQISTSKNEPLTNCEIKIGDHVFTTEDEHGKKHWIDSLNKVCKLRIDLVESNTDTNEKENQQTLTPVKKSQFARSTLTKISESNFLTLKRNFLRPKRDSIGFT